jgi:asparagine synthase (glutamine-hydrolysing)
MSGLAGVFMRDGAPADPAIVAAMAATTPYRRSDGEWSLADGCFAAIRQRTVTTVEDEHECGPVVDGMARLAMLFDGRIDNRTELAEALELPAELRRTSSDAGLALEAWKAWGRDTPARILGDFAFVVWDARERTLFCARDPMGVRPLFYYLSDCVFVFGSELRHVLEHPLVPREPDESTIAGLLQVSLTETARTLYRGIRRLPHAHALAVRSGSTSLWRYWELDGIGELVLRSDREYAEAFREVFDRAVHARLRSRGPVGAYLSGGLDSSSVVATARAVSAPTGTQLTAFSLVFPGHPDADERRYSDAVLRHADVPGVQLVPPPVHPDVARVQVMARGDLPDFPHDVTGESVRRAMAVRGIRVALTGSGGDTGLSGSHFHYADLLRRGRLIPFLRRYRDVARQPGMGWLSADLLPCAAWPLLPGGARRLLRPLARRLGRPGVPRWITSGLASRSGITRTRPLREIASGQFARTDIKDGFENAWTHMALDMYQRGSAAQAIEDRHPFFDRRVIEFALALPDQQRWQRGMSRYVLRRAMRGRLPPLVGDRPDDGKGDFSHVYLAPLQGLGGERFFTDSLAIAERDWVVAAEVRVLYRRMQSQLAAADPGYGDSAFRLWTIAAVEMWYSGIFGPRAGRERWKIRNAGTTTAAPVTTPAADVRTAVPC